MATIAHRPPSLSFKQGSPESERPHNAPQAPVPDALKRALFNASTRYAVLAWDGDVGFVYQKWAISLCGGWHKMDFAVELLWKMRQRGINRNVHTYSCLMNPASITMTSTWPSTSSRSCRMMVSRQP
ncbi:g6527 [Coccomyxa viridis]|uniref:G6527 protein n=1 Tax=Coccomyxa viridis TaxID=1274662 RepID=A0ABP1FY33_9CHLO